ncbi:hypothetical protein [Methyloferula stellata]|uniref:hypothetical protein n=1 Tax=Methyloferula stellata TaxID=876270 RepID=UPI00037B018A|nr:hypothetical protein [Methyloferula stellata]
MDSHENLVPVITGIHANAPAEKMLIAQYRSWMHCDTCRNLGFLDCAWTTLATALPFESAKAVFSECYIFMRILRRRACRPIEWRNDLRPGICDDECLLLRLVAASQRHDAFAEISVAAELLGTHKVEALVAASRSLARALEARHLRLEPIVEVTASEFSAFAQGSVTVH